MALCSIKLGMFEQAYYDLLLSRDSAVGIDIAPLIMIKLKYRTALASAYMRNWNESYALLKELKRLCNVYE